ncbi:MAG: 23S rRNA (adenine(2503)-C(2))-methyltransferase RlmN [Bacteroidales bacterium]|nr:23S rRNA (adenine(2503)-C(2))-methyltransferase RlmN [Bacteroidales bacterium]
MTTTSKADLLGLTLPQLQEVCGQLALPAFNAKQMAEWLYKKRATDIDQFSNLSLRTRAALKEGYCIGRSKPVSCSTSSDGTRKYLFAVGEGRHIETVYIPDGERGTLCVSSQAGCRMACRFCATGMSGYHGNLTASQILNQILSVDEAESLTNIVFMGMGEPLDNLDAVLQATTALTADWGMAWSPRRITVSTVGLAAPLKRFLAESQCHLAISLHSPFPDRRQAIMPAQQRHPLAATLSLLREYNWRGQRRLSFEYILFKGLNDDLMHASALVKLLHGLPCRVNLIPFHPNAGAPQFQPSPQAAVSRFQQYLTSHGMTATLRTSRGQDIDAACGLLASKQNPSTDIS